MSSSPGRDGASRPYGRFVHAVLGGTGVDAKERLLLNCFVGLLRIEIQRLWCGGPKCSGSTTVGVGLANGGRFGLTLCDNGLGVGPELGKLSPGAI
jgi:hypothetical protein